MNCKNCGASIDDASSFCDQCGEPRSIEGVGVTEENLTAPSLKNERSHSTSPAHTSPFVETAKRFESKLMKCFGATGTDLREMTQSIEVRLNDELQDALLYVFDIQNRASSDESFDGSDIEVTFATKCKYIEGELAKIETEVNLPLSGRVKDILSGNISKQDLIFEWEKSAGKRFVPTEENVFDVFNWSSLQCARYLLSDIPYAWVHHWKHRDFEPSFFSKILSLLVSIPFLTEYVGKLLYKKRQLDIYPYHSYPSAHVVQAEQTLASQVTQVKKGITRDRREAIVATFFVPYLLNRGSSGGFQRVLVDVGYLFNFKN